MQENRKYNVMVVDDDRQVLKLCSELLKLEGYNVIECYDPFNAIDLFSANPCDIVLSDIKMPGLTGIDLMRQIHNIDADVPVILFTAYVDVDTAVAALKEAAFDFIIKPYDPDILTKAIDRATQAIAYKRLQEEYHKRLEREVEEKTRELADMVEELRIARDRAEESSRLKTTILSNMSHEIRTPLNGIIGMAEVLLAQGLDDELKGYIELIKKSGWELNNILTNVIEISALDSGASPLVSVKIDIRSLLKALISEYEPLAKEKGIEISCAIDHNVPDAFKGDAHRLRQALLQLIDNAVKFTERGEIKIQVGLKARRPNWIELIFKVSDTGIGIPQDKLPFIFEIFRQVDESMTRKHGGLGLGLAIVQRVVVLMGGMIEVESQQGKGSVFNILIGFPTI